MEGMYSIIISVILFIPPGDSTPHSQLVCPNKFQPVGKFCYHFSDNSKPWKEAREACEKLGESGDNLNIMLASLDITGVPQDNQDLLTAVRDKHYKYWLGGHMDAKGDEAHWKWLDNRPIHLTAPYWREKSPNNTKGQECTLVSTYSKDSDVKKVHTRASLTDNDCSKDFRYICQAACPNGFQLIGKYCYYFSSMSNVSGMTWDDARNFCQGKSSDLAVMGLDLYNDQKMLDIIANAGSKVWLGGSDRDKDSHWFWLDGRPIPLVSYMWDVDAPRASVTHDVLVAKVITTAHNGDEKAVLDDATSSEERQFICQLLYTPPNGQIYMPVETGQVVISAIGRSGQVVIPGTRQVVIPGTGQVSQLQLVTAQGAPAQVVTAQKRAVQIVPQLQVVPGQVAPGQVAPSQVAPGRVAPGQVATFQIAPIQVAPVQSVQVPRVAVTTINGVPGVQAQPVPLVQTVQAAPSRVAHGTVSSSATVNGVPGVQLQMVPLVQSLQATPAVTTDDTVQSTATITADGKVQAVPIVQTLQGVQAVPSEDKVQIFPTASADGNMQSVDHLLQTLQTKFDKAKKHMEVRTKGKKIRKNYSDYSYF